MTSLAQSDYQPATLDFDQVADLLIETHHLIYLPEQGELYDFKDGVYVNGIEPELATLTEQHNWKAKNQFVNEVIGKIKRRVRHVKISEIEADPFLLNIKNGVLDLRTGELRRHSPGLLFLNQLDVIYDPRASSRDFQRFLASVLPEPIDRLRYIDHFASCLYRRPMKKEFFAVGETDSAKTTALNLIRLFLGSQNTASVSLQELESDRFAAADLFGKLANIHADLDSAELKRTSRFKTVTGRDQIRAQRKNGQPFHFVPYAKHFYSANKIPETKDESDAFFNRFDIVEFPFRFVSDPSQYTEIDGKIRSGFKLKDEKVLDKLLTPEGKSGILKVLVARVGRIVESNGIPSSMSDVEARDLWLYHSDFIENFLKDMAKFDPEARTSKADLYAAYCAYCIRHKQVPKSKTALNVRVERHGAQETVDKVEGRSVKRWKGIKLGGEKSVEPVTPLDSTVSTRNSPPASKHKLTNPGISDQELATANQALGNWEWAIR